MRGSEEQERAVRRARTFEEVVVLVVLGHGSTISAAPHGAAARAMLPPKPARGAAFLTRLAQACNGPELGLGAGTREARRPAAARTRSEHPRAASPFSRSRTRSPPADTPARIVLCFPSAAAAPLLHGCPPHEHVRVFFLLRGLGHPGRAGAMSGAAAAAPAAGRRKKTNKILQPAQQPPDAGERASGAPTPTPAPATASDPHDEVPIGKKGPVRRATRAMAGARARARCRISLRACRGSSAYADHAVPARSAPERLHPRSRLCEARSARVGACRAAVGAMRRRLPHRHAAAADACRVCPSKHAACAGPCAHLHAPNISICVQASFEELLARELAREQGGQQAQVQQPASKSASKATFLKRGLLSMGPPLHICGRPRALSVLA